MQKDILSDINAVKTREIYEVTTTGTVVDNVLTIADTLTGNFKYLTGRNIKVDSVNYTIVSSIKQLNDLLITLSGTPSILEPGSSVPVIISKDTVLETALANIITSLTSANTNDLSSHDVPTHNDYFAKYEALSGVLIQHSSAYKHENTLNSKIKTINDFINSLDIINKTRDQILSFKTDLDSKISYIDTMHTDVETYYDNLKKLVVKYKLSDLKISGKETDGMIDTRNDSDKAEVNNNYNYYLTNGKDAYNQKRTDDMFALKIGPA